MSLPRFVWYKIWVTCLVYGSSLGTNSKTDDCQIPYPDPSVAATYLKLHPSSKYIIAQVPSGTSRSRQDAESFCSDIVSGMPIEVAQVEHKQDLLSLEERLFESVWIGLHQDDEHGVFVQGNGGLIQFQTFVGDEPNNKGPGEYCVILRSNQEGGRNLLTMEDAECNAQAGFLCQFQKDNTCYMQSSEEIAAIEDLENHPLLVQLGTGSMTRFYMSNYQRNWADAFEICLEHGYQLISMNEDDVEQRLTEVIKSRMGNLRLHPATQFWTGGKYDFAEDSSASLSWMIGEEIEVPANETVRHTWAPVGLDRSEPTQQSAFEEVCLDISFENTATSSSKSHAPYWRVSNCLLPKYFICERIQYGSKEEDITSLVGRAENSEPEPDHTKEAMVCQSPAVDTVSFEVSLDSPITQEDIVKFMKFNIENGLSSGQVPLAINEAIKWRQTVIDLLFQIGKKSISTEYVDHGLLNVAKIINLLYQNALHAKKLIDNDNEIEWMTVYIPRLASCSDQLGPLPLSGRGFQITAITIPDNSGQEQEITIKATAETADKIPNLDSSIDILWFLFSLSVARCYPVSDDRLKISAEMHVTFVEDFMEPLREKWTINANALSTAEGLDYSLVMGDADFFTSMNNLRLVVSAAYAINNIKDLELVRPIDLSQAFVGSSHLKDNTKTENVV